jgi:hypothetical protein
MFDPTPIDAPNLNNLIAESKLAMQESIDFIMPEDMLINAVNSASDFFNQPHPYIVNTEGTWAMPNDATTFHDDIIGFSRQQMMQMGICGEDSLSLVMTHECCHRALQGNNALDSWSEELACDYFSGVRAAMHDMDTSNVEQALSETTGGSTHPVGSLRVDFLEYGKEVAQELQQQGIPPTFENCMQMFYDHLHSEGHVINSAHEQVSSILYDDLNIKDTNKVNEYSERPCADECQHVTSKWSDRMKFGFNG